MGDTRELEAIRKAVELGFSVRSFAIGGITVENRGLGQWAILDGGRCLGRDGAWLYEPMTSSRSEDFLARCRFPLGEAIQRAVSVHKGNDR